jgi:carboxypeptidase family protein
VPGARVDLVNMETAQRREGQTDATGDFLFAQLFPGTYRISVTAPGFRKHEEANIVVAAAERVVLRPIALQLGEVSESVTVAAQGGRVQTQSSERGALIDRVQIQVLPTKGRDIMDVVRLLPGVVDTGGHDVPGSGSTANMNINGARSRTINVAYDGISATDVGNQQGCSDVSRPAILNRLLRLWSRWRAADFRIYELRDIGGRARSRALHRGWAPCVGFRHCARV